MPGPESATELNDNYASRDRSYSVFCLCRLEHMFELLRLSMILYRPSVGG
ncbi:MAG: hypothetical protein AVDCRST_MAG37-467 [uncultured Rubrobacteraceae bacterium]|uniref:Uncharacterized protein n=1 Tax=uncultured Rubrobacteraceae bacterium TaxID=349277 RepID=A0A6J4Q0Y3_9ACTN|nr:MAG: hypothetical protein AVDCRST_MAG37-467 [uncultured Rubrobacteraceae bacterium]